MIDYREINYRKINSNSENTRVVDILYKDKWDDNDEEFLVNFVCDFKNVENSFDKLIHLKNSILSHYFDDRYDNDVFQENIMDSAYSLKFKGGYEEDTVKLLIEFQEYLYNYYKKNELFQSEYYKKYQDKINKFDQNSILLSDQLDSLDNKTQEHNDTLETLKEQSQKLDEQLKNNEKKALEILGIFIAVFTLVAGNTSVLYKTTDFTVPILLALLFIINGTLIISIQTLFKIIGAKFCSCYFLIPIFLNVLGVILILFSR